MKNQYRPVVRHTFVNALSQRVVTIALAVHNGPVFTAIAGPLAGHKVVTKRFCESREEARERFENRIESLVADGYVQVA